MCVHFNEMVVHDIVVNDESDSTIAKLVGKCVLEQRTIIQLVH